MSEKERQILYINVYIWDLESTDDITFRVQRKHRHREETFGLCVRRQGWDNLRG